MPFPLTHLCVSRKILESRPGLDPAQFLLGSIAPDAVHYRAEFQGAEMSNIGATKKISHLCPVSDQKWGQVTDNDGWIACVEDFLRGQDDSFAKGYAAHVLTDICNNLTLWNNFRTNHPEEAAKGYASKYYEDLRNIDSRLYNEHPAIPEIMNVLEKSAPVEMLALVTADEVSAIKHNLLYEHCKNISPNPLCEYHFVSYDDTLNFIENTAEFILERSWF